VVIDFTFLVCLGAGWRSSGLFIAVLLALTQELHFEQYPSLWA